MADTSPTSPIARRFPRSVYTHGTEPDPRFSLANERTYLAWIRTALALIAGGIALEAIGLPLHQGLREATSVLLLLGGAALPIVAWRHWKDNERAMRLSRPLPSSLATPLLTALIMVVAVLVILGEALA